MSARIDSRLTTRPARWSKSWRFTPRRRTRLPFSSRSSARVSTRRKRTGRLASSTRVAGPARLREVVREAYPDLQVQQARRQVVPPPADRVDVGDEDGSRRVQEHRTGDAAVPPLVLVLDEARV